MAIIHSHPYDSNVPDGTRQLSDEDRFNYRNLSRADNNFIAYLVDPRPQEQGNTGIVAFRGREYQGPTPVGAATCNVAVNGA